MLTPKANPEQDGKFMQIKIQVINITVCVNLSKASSLESLCFLITAGIIITENGPFWSDCISMHLTLNIGFKEAIRGFFFLNFFVIKHKLYLQMMLPTTPSSITLSYICNQWLLFIQDMNTVYCKHIFSIFFIRMITKICTLQTSLLKKTHNTLY